MVNLIERIDSAVKPGVGYTAPDLARILGASRPAVASALSTLVTFDKLERVPGTWPVQYAIPGTVESAQSRSTCEACGNFHDAGHPVKLAFIHPTDERITDALWGQAKVLAVSYTKEDFVLIARLMAWLGYSENAEDVERAGIRFRTEEEN